MRYSHEDYDEAIRRAKAAAEEARHTKYEQAIRRGEQNSSKESGRSCGVITVKGGEILAAIRKTENGYGEVCGPGGGIHEGESPIDGAKRELEEEFGVKAKSICPLRYGEEEDRGEKPYLFLCTKFEGEPKCKDGELENPIFLSLEELAAIRPSCFEPFYESIEYLNKALRYDDEDDEGRDRGGEAKGQEAGGHGNTRLPFGLCQRYGIDLPGGATPHDAWEALAGKGITPEDAYKTLKETGSAKEIGQESGQETEQPKEQSQETEQTEQPQEVGQGSEEAMGESDKIEGLSEEELQRFSDEFADIYKKGASKEKSDETCEKAFLSTLDKLPDEAVLCFDGKDGNTLMLQKFGGRYKIADASYSDIYIGANDVLKRYGYGCWDPDFKGSVPHVATPQKAAEPYEKKFDETLDEYIKKGEDAADKMIATIKSGASPSHDVWYDLSWGEFEENEDTQTTLFHISGSGFDCSKRREFQNGCSAAQTLCYQTDDIVNAMKLRESGAISEQEYAKRTKRAIETMIAFQKIAGGEKEAKTDATVYHEADIFGGGSPLKNKRGEVEDALRNLLANALNCPEKISEDKTEEALGAYEEKVKSEMASGVASAEKKLTECEKLSRDGNVSEASRKAAALEKKCAQIAAAMGNGIYEGKFLLSSANEEAARFGDIAKRARGQKSLNGLDRYELPDLPIDESKGTKKFDASCYTRERKDKAMWCKGVNQSIKTYGKQACRAFKDATEDERETIYNYTVGSGKFNRPLSGYHGTWDMKDYRGVGKANLNHEGAEQEISELTDFLGRNSFDSDIWVQHGFDGKNGFAAFLGIEADEVSEESINRLIDAGGECHWSSFMSCGAAKNTGFDESNYILNIYCPKGTKGAYIAPGSNYGGNGTDFTGTPPPPVKAGHENELLLQRDGNYRITKCERDGDDYYLDVEVVDQTPYDYSRYKYKKP